ncbi:efflux RND transporter permease subunit [Shinella sp. H4-D48]|uniref:efflux RND transporter permease subunit n=1 Tax=Shinella sp. H4-D48 TaxID=2925841 RepID=UPI002738BBA3|nr:efflux RND transporter permease subunit [Shinella sp. H4-D48]
MKPPAIGELRTTSGFASRLIDRGANGPEALQKASEMLVRLAGDSKLLQDVRMDGLPSGPSVGLHIDRAKAGALGVNFSTISNTFAAAASSTCIDNFPRAEQLQASRLLLRPIVMTSLAFTLGIVPLVIAKGPSSETQNAMGTGLFGGMITATVLAVLFVPVFFASIMRFAECKTLHQAAGAVRQ